MKITSFTIILFLTIQSFGQGFLKMDTLRIMPNEIKGLTNGKLKKGYRIDFNGDGRKDYILEMTPNEPNASRNVEYWITSNLATVKKKSKFGQDYDFFWFINLDKDVEPEIFRATGYEDGIDYAIYDHNLLTGKETLVFYLNPVIIEKQKTYWGYPWDISDMIIKNEGGNIFLQVSVEHDIVRDGVVTMPDAKKNFPVIFFNGHSTQPNGSLGQIRNVKWELLEKLR